MRRHAKAVNFGIIYGMQAFKLSQDTGVDMSFAKKYIESYFAYYPAVKKFIDETVRLAKENGYAETVMKRRRYIPEISHSNKNIARSGGRQAVNTVIQGSAADIIKIGTVNVHKMMREKHPESKILLQIHDELIIEAPENNIDIAKDCINELTKAGSFLEVPLVVNYSAGKDWSKLK
jgi:DNA polymerase-1